MKYSVTVVTFAVIGFIVMYCLGTWLFQDFAEGVYSGILGAVVGAALVLVSGPEQVRHWRW